MAPNFPPEPNGPRLHAEARAAIVTTATLTRRQIPHGLEQTAWEQFAAVWAVGTRHGVQPEDWRAITSQPTACIDVLAAVERRTKFGAGA